MFCKNFTLNANVTGGAEHNLAQYVLPLIFVSESGTVLF